MYPGDYWWPHGGFWFMWIIPVVFLILLAVFFFRGGAACWGHRGHDRDSRPEGARDILDRRYASGEITKEQYEEMKRTLQR
jgi:putative membrane protein